MFGCPVFVLDKRLQDGDSLPKWRSRCWNGVYVGQSLQHAGNVPLVYNPSTSHVSPQYHITFDDTFSTVCGSRAVLPDSVYCRLFDSTDWMFDSSYGPVDDLHLFDSFWSDPPAIKRQYKTPLVPGRHVHHVSSGSLLNESSSDPFQAFDTIANTVNREHAVGDQAPQCDHALGKQASRCKHAQGEQAPGCDQASGKHAPHCSPGTRPAEGLNQEGFMQSKTDSCLFLWSDCIIVVYVDDCLFFSPSATVIDKVIVSLSKTFKLKDEGNVSAFLGVQIAKDSKTKSISLTQPSLIEQIIRDVGITQFSKGKETPVDGILYPDPDGPPRAETWNYRSVIGKLNYLANNTRPDISMAVHQCAPFCTQPMALHELAVKRIARYLLATKDKGFLLRPTNHFSLDMYVDADFAGRWHKEYSHLRDNVLSRTGYVVMFCGCPVSWASKLQSEIALSTTESEYIALSSATRELLPLRRVLNDILQYTFIHLPSTTNDTISSSTFHSVLPPSQIFEDNNACIVLATSEGNFKPRTKHISLKFHHFKDQIVNGTLQVIKVDSAQNWADIFTKPLGRIKFEDLRRLLMGW